jgi:putative inorganic carbon (HCO3(-)) transporter
MIASWLGAPGTPLDTLPGRLEIWNRALIMLLDFPITGVGLGQFPIVLRTFYPAFTLPVDQFVPHAHNFYLQLALDLGVPGAVAVLALLTTLLRNLLRLHHRTADRELRTVALGVGAGLISFLIFGLTDAIAAGARGGILLWILLGLGMAVTRLAGRQPERVPIER